MASLSKQQPVADLDSEVYLKGDQRFFSPHPFQCCLCPSGLNLTVEWELKQGVLLLQLVPGHPRLSSPYSHPVSRIFPSGPPSWSLFFPSPLLSLGTFLFQALLSFPECQGLSSPSAVCAQKPNKCLSISRSGLGLPGRFGMCPLSNSGLIRLYSCPRAGFLPEVTSSVLEVQQRPPGSVHNLSHSQHFGMNLFKYVMNSQHKFLIRP